MKVKFIISTKRTAMPKGITLKIKGQAEFPKGTTKAKIIQELKEYGLSQLKSKNFLFTSESLNVALG